MEQTVRTIAKAQALPSLDSLDGSNETGARRIKQADQHTHADELDRHGDCLSDHGVATRESTRRRQ